MSRRITSPFGTVFIDEDGSNVVQSFQSLLGDESVPAHRHEAVSMTPVVDIYEGESQYLAWMDLPGVDKDSIKVTVSGNTLSVNAETKKLSQEGGHWIRHERPVGKYVRSLHMGQAVDADSVAANYADGTLKLTINKKTKGKTRAINVNME